MQCCSLEIVIADRIPARKTSRMFPQKTRQLLLADAHTCFHQCTNKGHFKLLEEFDFS